MSSKATEKKRVVVLEDQGVRVDWLRKYFGKYIDLVWCTSVEIFLEQIQEPYSLVILDHDLHLSDTSGKKAPTGADAARAITRKTPVIIWSINKNGASNMHSILRRKDITPHWVPFGSDDLHLINVIVKALK